MVCHPTKCINIIQQCNFSLIISETKRYKCYLIEGRCGMGCGVFLNRHILWGPKVMYRNVSSSSVVNENTGFDLDFFVDLVSRRKKVINMHRSPPLCDDKRIAAAAPQLAPAPCMSHLGMLARRHAMHR